MKNNLLLRTLKGEKTERPPVWMMRQAGRYLPEFMALKEKYDFFTRCQTPELATEITLQPIRRIAPDAAILFSDILVVPQAMGIHIEMKPNLGPWIEQPIRSDKDIDRLIEPNIDEHLGYVLEAIRMTSQALNNELPLIGFAGSPWTIFCYIVQGQGSKTYDIAKRFCFEQPASAHRLLQKITDTTIAYLKAKVVAGCQVIQLFDSWGGVLSPKDYTIFSQKYINQIVMDIAKVAPVIVFAKGCWHALPSLSQTAVSALGIDWTCAPEQARAWTGGKMVLQGNFDPARLYSPIKDIEKMAREMVDTFGSHHYIANLGHGILPDIPVDHARAFVDSIKSYT